MNVLAPYTTGSLQICVRRAGVLCTTATVVADVTGPDARVIGEDVACPAVDGAPGYYALTILPEWSIVSAAPEFGLYMARLLVTCNGLTRQLSIPYRIRNL